MGSDKQTQSIEHLVNDPSFGCEDDVLTGDAEFLFASPSSLDVIGADLILHHADAVTVTTEKQALQEAGGHPSSSSGFSKAYSAKLESAARDIASSDEEFGLDCCSFAPTSGHFGGQSSPSSGIAKPTVIKLEKLVPAFASSEEGVGASGTVGHSPDPMSGHSYVGPSPSDEYKADSSEFGDDIYEPPNVLNVIPARVEPRAPSVSGLPDDRASAGWEFDDYHPPGSIDRYDPGEDFDDFFEPPFGDFCGPPFVG